MELFQIVSIILFVTTVLFAILFAVAYTGKLVKSGVKSSDCPAPTCPTCPSNVCPTCETCPVCSIPYAQYIGRWGTLDNFIPITAPKGVITITGPSDTIGTINKDGSISMSRDGVPISTIVYDQSTDSITINYLPMTINGGEHQLPSVTLARVPLDNSTCPVCPTPPPCPLYSPYFGRWGNNTSFFSVIAPLGVITLSNGSASVIGNGNSDSSLSFNDASNMIYNISNDTITITGGTIVPSGNYSRVPLDNSTCPSCPIPPPCPTQCINTLITTPILGTYTTIAATSNTIASIINNIASPPFVTMAQLNPYMRLDVGSDMNISAIEIINRSDCCQSGLVGATVALYTSANSTSSPVWTATLTNQAMLYELPINKVGRYIKITGHFTVNTQLGIGGVYLYTC